jgi:hypothetical protein
LPKRDRGFQIAVGLAFFFVVFLGFLLVGAAYHTGDLERQLSVLQQGCQK